jgi:iron complex transport system ATP-binding protein
MSDAAIAIDSVSARRGQRLALAEVSLALAPGEVVAVIGANGSGKSTLAMVATGLLAPSAGAVRLRGRALAGLAPAERAREVAYVPQRSELAAPLLVREVVAMGRYALGDAGGLGRPTPAAAAAIAEALRVVDAAALAERRFTELSGGEAQRVVLARALATGAPALVLDEPTSALDVAHRLALAEVVRALARAGKAVLVALHDLDEARAVADRVLLLKEGRVVALGPTAAVIAPGPVREAYGVELVEQGGLGFRLASRAEMK